MTTSASGNPVIRTLTEAESNNDKDKVSSFSYKEFWKWLKNDFKTNVLSALALLAFGIVLPSVIHIIKQYDFVQDHSLVANVKFSILFESMYNSHAPMLLGFIMYANTLIMLFMTDLCITFSKKIYSIVLSTAIAASLASLILMGGYYLNLVSGEPDWLDLWSMTINYLLTTLFAMKFLFVSTGLFKSPNRGTPLQYTFLSFSYFGAGIFLVKTNLSEEALKILIIVVSNCIVINLVVLVCEGRQSLKKNAPLDKLAAAIAMIVVGIMYAGVLFLACQVSMSTKEPLCSMEFSFMAERCREFKDSLLEQSTFYE